MGRQLPKNVRQIGNVSDNPKIYVEDYVDTYLNQLREKAKEQPIGVILAGEVLELETKRLYLCQELYRCKNYRKRMVNLKSDKME